MDYATEMQNLLETQWSNEAYLLYVGSGFLPLFFSPVVVIPENFNII